MSTMTDMYRTPEGFELAKPLVFPEVRDFAELFTFERFWDFATMNYKDGYPQPGSPAQITREGFEREVGRFCSARNVPGSYHMQVTPTDMVMDALFGDGFAFFDRIGFELIWHERTNRVLVVASASGILASRYLAYIDPATVPTREV